MKYVIKTIDGTFRSSDGGTYKSAIDAEKYPSKRNAKLTALSTDVIEIYNANQNMGNMLAISTAIKNITSK